MIDAQPNPEIGKHPSQRDVSHHLAKESPENDGRMKVASEGAIVLYKDLGDQFFGK